jgi:dihydroorotate dehydrogenase
MPDLYAALKPFVFKLDPEQAHDYTLKLMKSGLMPPPGAPVRDKALEVDLWGHKFPNPVGLAAGFDKNAEVIAAAFALGFGFVETGTVTPRAQDGNAKPRVFRDVKSESIINAMGFPNKGANVFKSNIEKFLSGKQKTTGVVGINIGMNKSQTEPAKDYASLINTLGPMADYLTVNISSPNTPGLRSLQERGALLDLIGVLNEERKKACGDHPPPLLVKFAPDLDDAKQEELAKAALDAGIDGLVLTNTTLDRPEFLPSSFTGNKGGLSGRPLTQKSTDIIRNFYRLTKGKLPIIGVGGVSSGADAYEKIKAGASLVQLYTGLVFKGPSVANSINRELLQLLKSDGLKNISQAVGKDAK